MSTIKTNPLHRTSLAIAASLFCAVVMPPHAHAADAGDSTPTDATAPASATATATAAQAADTKDADTTAKKPTSLATIVVTAQKREQAALDVPGSVTAIDTTTLSSGGLDRLEDYVDQVPGMSLTSLKPGEAQITIRGISTGLSQSAPTTSIYIDEAPIGSVNAYTAGSQLAPDIDPADLRQIEVLKGPQGTLYGAGAMGGLLHYITAAPDFQHEKGSVTLGGESVDGGGYGGVARAYFNIPLDDGRMALQVNGFDRRDPGFIDDLDGRKDVNAADERGGRVALSWILNDDWRLTASAMTQRVRDQDQQTEDVNPQTLKPLYGNLIQNALIPQPADTTLDLYNVTLHGHLGVFSVVSSTTYQTLDANATGDVTESYGALLGAILGIPDFGSSISQFTTTNRFSQEVRLDADALDNRLHYEFGGYFTHESDTNKVPGIDPFSTITLQPIPLPFYLIKAEIDSTYREFSGFANATYDFTPQFSVQGGLRYSSEHQTYGQDYSGLLEGPVPLVVTDGREQGDQTTYLVTTTFKPTKDDALYARVATGYRPGGPNAVPPPSVFPAPLTFMPDSLTSYEVGYKSVMDDGKLSLDTALFTTNWKNIQIQTSAGGFNFFVNGGAARSKGAEATLLFNPTASFSVHATAAYTDATLTEDAPLAGGVSGDELPFVPKVTASLGSEYRWNIGNWGASIGGSVNYTGQRISDYSLRSGVEVPAYTTVDLDTSIERNNWRFTLYGKNLGNSGGITYLTSKTLFPGVGPAEAGIIQPRTVGVEANYRF